MNLVHEFCKKYQHPLQLAAITAGVILLQLLFLVTVVLPRLDGPVCVSEVVADGSGLPMQEKETAEQIFYCENKLRGIELPLGTYGNEILDGFFHVEVYDEVTGDLLVETEENLAGARDNAYFQISWEEPIEASDKMYRIELSVHNLDPEAGVVIWQSETDVSGNETCAVYCGEETGEYLAVAALGGAGFLLPMYLVICAVLLALVIVIGIMAQKRAKPQTMFAVAAILLGMLLMVVYPSYSVYDEERHIPWAMARASAWASGHWDVEDGVGIIREEEQPEGYTMFKPGTEQYWYFTNTLFELEESDEMVEIESEPSGVPYEYLPQIAGVLLSRALHLGQTATLYLSQTLALLFYVVLCWIAIRISPYPTMFAIVALFPSVLRTGGSFSYDCFINSVGLLLVALWLRMADESEPVTWKQIASVLILSLLLAPCKGIYIPIVLMIFLVPLGRWRKKWHRNWILAFLLLASLTMLLLGIGDSLSVKVSGSGTVVGPWRNEAYSLSMLLGEPLELLRITLVSMFEQGVSLVFSAVGGIQHINLPTTVNCLLVLLAVFAIGIDHQFPTIKTKCILGFIILLTVGLGYAASISWTTVGNYTFMGMQGRYLVPVLPLIFLIVPQRPPTAQRRETLLYSAVLLVSYSVLFEFMQVIW